MTSTLRRARLALVAALFFLSVDLPTLAAQPAELAGLEPYIEQAMRDWEIPGLAIAIVQADAIVYARGFGERRLGAGELVDADNLFGDVRVDLENGRLVLHYSPDYVADLEYWHYDTFRAWRSDDLRPLTTCPFLGAPLVLYKGRTPPVRSRAVMNLNQDMSTI